MTNIHKNHGIHKKAAVRSLFLSIDNLDDSAIACDLEGIILNCNKSAEELYGYKKEELTGESINLIFEESNINEIVIKLKNDHRVKRFEAIRKNKDGIRFLVSISVSPIYKSGKISGFICIGRDMSEKYKANQTKSQFLANMSHELRTPLNGILGFTQLLKLSQVNEEQREEIEMIEKSSNYLLNLINGILDLSKIEAGKIKLNYSEFNIREQAYYAIRELTLMTKNKNLEILYYIDPFISEMLTGDIVRLKQVLNNLISNAVKFTDSGHIYLKIKEVSKTIDETKLEFSVEDTGKGISDDFKKKIFDEFTQEENTYTKNYGGAGLGLAISKDLVSLMGGDIWVESKMGKGSTFYFTALFKNVHNEDIIISKKIAEIDKSDNNEKTILVAEDNEINLKIITAYLKRLNYNYDYVKNGQDAVSFLEKSKADIVLMDIQMPVLSGIDAAKIIREKEKLTGNHQIIVAMTAYAMEGDKERFLESGMDGYISKPFDMDMLNETLSKLSL